MGRDDASGLEERPGGFDETLTRIQAIVERLESGDLSLEESLKLFEEGMTLVRSADKTLQEAELRIERLLSGGDRESLDEAEFLES